jgi:hypothetical protein
MDNQKLAVPPTLKELLKNEKVAEMRAKEKYCKT